MSQIVTICGFSDDLIEVEGALSEEFYAHDKEGDRLTFSTGTVVDIIYDDHGIWRITLVERGQIEDWELDPAPNGDDDDFIYSDVATLTADRLEWVRCEKIADE